jgi:hypothetical protein
MKRVDRHGKHRTGGFRGARLAVGVFTSIIIIIGIGRRTSVIKSQYMEGLGAYR